MIARILRILGILAAIPVALAFAVGTAFGFVSRLISAAAARGLRAAVPAPANPHAITRRGIKAGVVLAFVGLVIVGGILGILVVVSGIVPIKASSGHWAITEWFLHFSMKRSVSTHSLGTEVPSLDDPAMVLKGAGHYEIGCRSCHGSPSMPQPRIAQQMTPQPPFLPPEIPKWESEELFYIVKHGVKFTGMPAWPSLVRDDEVWAMVAFLRKLPGLSAEEYQRLIRAEAPAAEPMQKMITPTTVPESVIRSCVPCHGADGLGRGTGAFPKLAGQRIEYLRNALAAYASGARNSGIMQPIAASMKTNEIEEVAQYYSSLAAPAANAQPFADAAAVERGRQIAEHGNAAKRLPSCVDCHGPTGWQHKPAYPRLAGQYPEYLLLQLELFKNGKRGGSAYSHIMQQVAQRLEPQEMRDVAAYFGSLAAEPDRQALERSASADHAQATTER